MSKSSPDQIRFLPSSPLPAYTYIPGEAPHPISDPRGHSYGVTPKTPPPLDPELWRESTDYLKGVDLFNHGYFWEAHEAWEGLWHMAGRRGVTGTFLKGIIQLAVAGVKWRQGLSERVAVKARRAAELLRETGELNYAGLDLTELIAESELLQSDPSSIENMRIYPED